MAMPHDALHDLLDRNLLLPAEYADGLTNHLPMALHALDRMGADASRLCRFFDVYAARFEPQQATCGAAAVLSDWLPRRGRYASLPALRATFAEALRRDDPAAVLRHVVPHLMSGVGAAAFHGLLRTAHAVEAGHPGELACGLAYWAARWFPLEPVPAAHGPFGFEAWSARLARAAGGWRSSGALISQRMRDAEQALPYRALAGSLVINDDILAQLAGFAAALYAETGNFTVLHLVTGCRAARVMLPFAGDAADARGSLVRAFTAACLASGVARARRLAPPAPVEWSVLAAGALASDDDHVIKLIDACKEEAAFYGDTRHRQAAARALLQGPA